MTVSRNKSFLAAIVALTAIPALFLEAYLYSDLLSSAGHNIGLFLRIFILFCCVFDLPAYIIGIGKPRVGGLWLLVNVTVTLAFFIGLLVCRIFAAHAIATISWPNVLFEPPLLAIFKGIALFCTRFIAALALIRISALQFSHDGAKSLSTLRHAVNNLLSTISVAYSALWVFYLFSIYLG